MHVPQLLPTARPHARGLFALLALAAALWVAAPALGAPPVKKSDTAPPAKPDEKTREKPAEKVEEKPAPPAAKTETPPTVWVLMETSKGDIVLELDHARAPISVDNFLAYVDAKFYDGTVFHRVIPTFMIQGGGFDSDLKPRKTNAPIKNEYANGLRNERGTITFARSDHPDSARSQFFINVKDNPALNGSVARNSPGYAVFGKVIVGMDVVDVIKVVPTKPVSKQHEAVPLEPVVITKVSRMTEEEAAKRRAAAATALPPEKLPPEKLPPEKAPPGKTAPDQPRPEKPADVPVKR